MAANHTLNQLSAHRIRMAVTPRISPCTLFVLGAHGLGSVRMRYISVVIRCLHDVSLFIHLVYRLVQTRLYIITLELTT